MIVPGKIFDGGDYWQTLETTFFRYINHPEHKFENATATGTMQRRHIKNPEINYIGKEVRNFDPEEEPRSPLALEDGSKKELPKDWSRQRKYYWSRKLLS